MILFLVIAGFLAVLPPIHNLNVPEMDQQCLECICKATSNCDETLRCHAAGGGYFCGPYAITWAYWHDGGRPGDKGGPQDFEHCLTNKACAQQAVRGYMKRYGRDCDNNGVIDCWDFSRIHKMGFGQCSDNAVLQTDFYKNFATCMATPPPPPPPPKKN